MLSLLFGGDDDSPTKTTALNILNDTTIQRNLKNVSKNINTLMLNIIQKTVTNAAVGANINQKVVISGNKSGGSLTISGIKQTANVKINLSMLTETDLQSDLSNEVLSEMKTSLKDVMTAEQKTIENDEEQMLSEIAGVFNNLIDSVAGTSTDDTTTIQNKLGLSSDTEIQNIIDNSISNELVNETITNISNIIVADQQMIIQDNVAAGDIIITEIEQSYFTDTVTEGITQAGVGSKVVNGLVSGNDTDISAQLDSIQDTDLQDKGTISAVSDLAGTVLDGTFGNIFSTPVLIIAGIVGVVFIMFFFGGKGGAGNNMRIIKTPKKIPSIVKKTPTVVKNTIQKGGSYLVKKINYNQGLLFGLLTLITIALFYYFTKDNNNNNDTENFKMDNEEKILKIDNNKYVQLKDNKLCITNDRKQALKLQLSSIDKNKLFLYVENKETKKYLRIKKDEFILDKYNYIYDKDYGITIDNINNKNIIFVGKKYFIGQKDNCLTPVKDVKNAINMTINDY
jgi:hypothetical protein